MGVDELEDVSAGCAGDDEEEVAGAFSLFAAAICQAGIPPWLPLLLLFKTLERRAERLVVGEGALGEEATLETTDPLVVVVAAPALLLSDGVMGRRAINKDFSDLTSFCKSFKTLACDSLLRSNI